MCAKPRPRPFIGVASTQVHDADMDTHPPPHMDMMLNGVPFSWCPTRGAAMASKTWGKSGELYLQSLDDQARGYHHALLAPWRRGAPRGLRQLALPLAPLAPLGPLAPLAPLALAPLGRERHGGLLGGGAAEAVRRARLGLGLGIGLG